MSGCGGHLRGKGLLTAGGQLGTGHFSTWKPVLSLGSTALWGIGWAPGQGAGDRGTCDLWAAAIYFSILTTNESVLLGTFLPINKHQHVGWSLYFQIENTISPCLFFSQILIMYEYFLNSDILVL